MAGAAAALASYEARQAAVTQRDAERERRDARRRLVAVGLGAGVLIVLLLLTAQDVARAALERRADDAAPGSRRQRQAPGTPPDQA